MTSVDFRDWHQPTTSAAQDDLIYSGKTAPGGQTFDVSAYQTLIIHIAGGGTAPLIRQLDSTGAIVDAELIQLNSGPLVWRLIGTQLQVIGDIATNIVLVGSTRPAAVRFDSRQFAAGLTSMQVNPVVVGNNDFGAAGVFTSFPMGPASVRFAATSAVTAGYFALVQYDGTIVMPVCETTELIAGPSAGKGTMVKNLYLPAQCGFRYVCTGAAGGIVSVIVAAGSIP